MFLTYGNKTARIKKYTEYQITCLSCKKNDMDVKIYRDYFHVYFIPFCPMGDNVVHVRCKVCDEPVRDENIKKNIKNQVKAPSSHSVNCCGLGLWLGQLYGIF
jgi:hypothetical protein